MLAVVNKGAPAMTVIAVSIAICKSRILRGGGKYSSSSVTNISSTPSEGARNSGKNNVAQHWDTWAKLIEINPQNAAGTIGTLLASTAKGKERLAAAISASKAPSEIRALEAGAIEKEVIARNTPQRLDLENRQTAANIRNIDDQIRDRTNRFNLDSSRLKLDQDRLQSDVEATTGLAWEGSPGSCPRLSRSIPTS